MLATSPSPSIRPSTTHESGGLYSPRLHYDQSASTKPVKPRPAVKQHRDQGRKFHFSPDLTFHKPHRNSSTRSLDRYSPPPRPRVKMVDASTQYSPPNQQASHPSSTKTPTSTIAGLRLSEKEHHPPQSAASAITTTRRESAPRPIDPPSTTRSETTAVQAQPKRQAVEPAGETLENTNGVEGQELQSSPQSLVKKLRPDAPPLRMMPILYENCNTRDLVVLISSMLMELIRYNDAIPLRDGQLTRFHSRAPPGISVLDYLQRLTTHATLSPPILLSVVYYIDRLCALYPAFTISSLTVHRFLITSATVASKGLSDSFWTNKTYARVGGVSMKELALLELEFLTRMEWRIVPKPEVLVDYYKSLIARNSQYQLEGS